MRTKQNKTGFTLTELMVAMAIMAVLAGVMIPAAKALISSFENADLTGQIIGAALKNARAVAMASDDVEYAGIRFQHDGDGNQYMILITKDIDTMSWSVANGFKAVKGHKPMKLPATLGVMDLKYSDRVYNGNGSANLGLTQPLDVASDTDINADNELNDTTTFSIIFSSSGKLVTRQVWVRNRAGLVSGSLTEGDVFNVIDNVDNGIGKFLQDDHDGSPTSVYPAQEEGYGFENSRNSFVIYNKDRLKSVPSFSRWTDYLQYLKVAYVNPYSGQIIMDSK